MNVRSTAVIAGVCCLFAREVRAQSAAPAQEQVPARASEAPATGGGDEERRAAARQRFLRGVELIRAGQWSEAIAELEAARDLRATPPVHYNLALAQRAVGRYRASVASLRAFLRTVSSTADPALISQAEQLLQDSSSAVCRLEVSVEPITARVRIDGAPIELGAGAIELDPGEHTVTAVADGFANGERRVRLSRGSNSVASLTLVRTNELSYLRVESNVTESLIRIDGREVGHGTIDEIVRAGRHTVDVLGPHHRPFTREIQSFVGQRQVIRASLADRRTIFDSPWFYVVTGVVVAAGVTTAIILWPAPPPLRGTLGDATAP
ncbi:MAG: PEGA domain-containing protein [Myxococcales bacterium]|nr:PEGA domain-containing protein [Myxococcales bacterium]